MSPAYQRACNVSRFQALLAEDQDPALRARIERLLAEEQSRPDSDYPAHTMRGPRDAGPVT